MYHVTMAPGLERTQGLAQISSGMKKELETTPIGYQS
jgi:hypothetical protein